MKVFNIIGTVFGALIGTLAFAAIVMFCINFASVQDANMAKSDRDIAFAIANDHGLVPEGKAINGFKKDTTLMDIKWQPPKTRDIVIPADSPTIQEERAIKKGKSIIQPTIVPSNANDPKNAVTITIIQK